MVYYLILLKSVAFFALAHFTYTSRKPNTCAFIYVVLDMLGFSINYSWYTFLIASAYSFIAVFGIYHFLHKYREVVFMWRFTLVMGWLLVCVNSVVVADYAHEWIVTDRLHGYRDQVESISG